MFFEGYGYHGTSFEQTYRCYPASFIDKPQLESGDKIIMPPSALDRLASLHIDYPMLFELRNAATERVSHCGVLEFIAEEGMIYMPYWMMENMLLQEGDTVRVKNATLPKGAYVKLQPHTMDFLDISNPKAILETTLRNFSCLTTGDSIMVAYNNKKYYIDIVETKPANAISIIETDCEVDFAPPLDYKEPERAVPSVASSKASAQVQEPPVEEEPKFNPFTGVARRLDGKPLIHQPSPVSSSEPKDKRPEAANAGGQHSSSSSSQNNSSRQQQGKLVFGSSTNRTPKEAQKENYKELMDARYTEGMERPPIDLELWERASGVKKNYVQGLGQKRRYSNAETCSCSSYSSQSSQTSPHPPPHTPADCLRAVCQDRRLLAELSLHLSTLTTEDMALAAAEAVTEAATTADAEAEAARRRRE